MTFNNKKLNKQEINKSSYLMLAFIGTGVGALLGLIAYVKDWF